MKKYSKLTSHHVAELVKLLGEAHVSQDTDTLFENGHDETENLHFPPEVVVFPRTAEEIGAVLRLANAEQIAVTARGAGTGLSGGALPVFHGIVLSMKRFDRILAIDEENLQATVEPGVINEVFQQAVKAKNLFYPPDPASKGSCFLGGNVAESSGGPKCVKYGTTKDYILNLEVVLPTGEIIHTGANTLKNSTGYNLTQLMVGSEGTLGIVTKIVVKLLPLPKHDLLMLVPFYDLDEACVAVSQVFRAGYIPSALELMERDALEWVSRYVESSVVKLEAGIQAHLLVEVDGNDPNQLMTEMEAMSELFANFRIGEILFAESAAQKAELWRLRRGINEAVKRNAISKEQDTVVPRASLPKLVKGVKEICGKSGVKSICYGHAGDGNLHIRIIRGELSEEQWEGSFVKNILTAIFELCYQLGGTISGEHGIGLVQQDFMSIVFAEKALEIQRAIKLSFDPNLILNPGKMFYPASIYF